MKVLETTTYQYLLPNHTESFGKVGSQVYGTLVGAGKETAMVNLEGKLFTMDASLVKDKKEGDSLAFEITGHL